ncbi:hypothetical protein CY34DRAFT_14547 [Suillus luteus UH-Slu-Lm8-n1]|uniref:Uncharacterized protein n=1 Tax=Suillus luteus UH-Slu-Lm8-n1 TaxID=930992 RepID=A0A0D0AXT2_9AGAM|nr:hypothetical protein CY34DRAFT_14547 [Suillus luteus UH-Slu-Lm8-n1]
MAFVLIVFCSKTSEAHHPLGDLGPVSPTMQSIATTSQRKRAHVETNEAAGSTSAAQPEGDELGEFNIDNNDYNAHQDQDEVSFTPTYLPNAPSHPPSPPEPAPSQSPSPDPAQDDDIEPPQQNIDQHVCINVDIDKLKRLAVLPKQKDAIAFIQALQHATLDNLCTKLNEAALHHL